MARGYASVCAIRSHEDCCGAQLGVQLSGCVVLGGTGEHKRAACGVCSESLEMQGYCSKSSCLSGIDALHLQRMHKQCSHHPLNPQKQPLQWQTAGLVLARQLTLLWYQRDVSTSAPMHAAVSVRGLQTHCCVTIVHAGRGTKLSGQLVLPCWPASAGGRWGCSVGGGAQA